MTEWGKFGGETAARPMECAVCEAMCPDAVDGTLTEAERRVFERHVAGCVRCAQEFEEAQRGAAWLGVLKGHTPEPPKALLAKILAETTGVESSANPLLRDETAQKWGTQGVGEPGGVDSQLASLPVVPAREPAPAWALSSVLRRAAGVFRIETARATFQPRLAMTAAMAFFSIALTLNLAGVRLKNLRASDFTPSGLRRNVADAGASVARDFQNMRVVYQVESRVSELRGEGPLAEREDVNFTPQASQTSAQPEQQQQQRAVRAPRRKGL